MFFPKTDRRIGRRNVRTLYEMRKVAQVAREMDRYSIEILGRSEVRWTSSGKVMLSLGHVLLYTQDHMGEDEIHMNGVGIMVTKKGHICLTEWEPVNGRLITTRVNSIFQKVTLVQCYLFILFIKTPKYLGK